MVCKSKPCKIKKSNTIENSDRNIKIKWSDYPSPEEERFGHGKFCYFISCPDSELPIRDYVYEKKAEPCYERQSYNEYAPCNQSGIRNANSRGISYIIFYTKYQGIKECYRNGYFITGLFPISAQREIDKRIAYKSTSPIFLSIEDSIELNDEVWKKWFYKDIPKDYRGCHKFAFYGEIC